MGLLGILDVLWDVHQEANISAAQAQLKSANRALDSQNQTLDSLSSQLASAAARIDQLDLVALAVWELLAERLGLTVEQLRAKADEIDLRDGTRDGRYTGATPRCTGCAREVAPWRQRCLFCGQPRAAATGLGDVAKLGGEPAS
jgi:hypothetical protein